MEGRPGESRASGQFVRTLPPRWDGAVPAVCLGSARSGGRRGRHCARGVCCAWCLWKVWTCALLLAEESSCSRAGGTRRLVVGLAAPFLCICERGSFL